MSPEQFKISVDLLGVLVAENLPVINEKMALNAFAMMRDRIQNEGTIGENKSLGTYSDNPLPAFFFKGKSLNAKGEEFYLKASKKGKGISYKDWRQANNRPVDKKNLTFSGTTLNDIGVVKQEIQNNKAVTVIGAKNTKTRKNGDSTDDVLGFLADDYGDILEPNREETAKLQNFLSNETLKLVKQVFK